MSCVCGWPALVLVADLLPAEDVLFQRHIPTSMHWRRRFRKATHGKPALFQNPLVEVVELVELIWRSGLGIEEHIAAGFRYPLQKMLRSAVEG